MLENTAKQRIDYISGFMEYPVSLCKEDWDDWRPLIACACAFVNHEYRNKGIEVTSFFNLYFSDKKYCGGVGSLPVGTLVD